MCRVHEAGPPLPGGGGRTWWCWKQLVLSCVCVEGRGDSVQRGSQQQATASQPPSGPERRGSHPLVCRDGGPGVDLAWFEGFGEEFAPMTPSPPLFSFASERGLEFIIFELRTVFCQTFFLKFSFLNWGKTYIKCTIVTIVRCTAQWH